MMVILEVGIVIDIPSHCSPVLGVVVRDEVEFRAELEVIGPQFVLEFGSVPRLDVKPIDVAQLNLCIKPLTKRHGVLPLIKPRWWLVVIVFADC